jgi:hypothetical protein
MSVKRFVSWLRRDRSDRNRIRAMWEPEFDPRQSASDLRRLIVWLVILTIAVIAAGKTVL